MRWSLLAAVLVTGATGCGKREASVTGVVTLGGKPLAGGQVHIQPADGPTRSGLIGPDGRFRVPHLPRGEARVAVVGGPAAPAGPPELQKTMPADGGPKRTAAAAVEVPAKYADPAASGLTVNLVGGEQTRDITLR